MVSYFSTLNLTAMQHFDLNRLRAVSISRVAEAYGRVVKKGCRMVAICPWHDDHHPSLTLYENARENRCHCFACGRGGSVIDFVMASERCDFAEACRIVAGIGGIFPDEPIAGSWKAPKTIQPKPEPKPVVYDYIPDEWLEQRVSAGNSLCRCLNQLFNSCLVDYLVKDYRLGCYETKTAADCVLFPNIDTQGRICNIKVQHYETDIRSPRFAHGDRNICFWLGRRLASEGVVRHDAEFDNQCLFGSHLLPRYPQVDVMLVESPKNAVVGAAACPQYVWVATGSKSLLNRRALQVLRGRRVMVYPDRDAIREWTEKLQGMRDLFDYRISGFCESFAPKGEEKFDIADFIISERLKLQ